MRSRFFPQRNPRAPRRAQALSWSTSTSWTLRKQWLPFFSHALSDAAELWESKHVSMNLLGYVSWILKKPESKSVCWQNKTPHRTWWPCVPWPQLCPRPTHRDCPPTEACRQSWESDHLKRPRATASQTCAASAWGRSDELEELGRKMFKNHLARILELLAVILLEIIEDSDVKHWPSWWTIDDQILPPAECHVHRYGLGANTKGFAEAPKHTSELGVDSPLLGLSKHYMPRWPSG